MTRWMLVAMALLVAQAAHAQDAGSETTESPLRRVRVWGNLGATWAYGTTYVSLGAGAGYLLDPGFLPTLDVAFSFGDPVVIMLKPGLDWFPPLPGQLRPYLGAYYAHWFVTGGYLPQDAWGVRGGVSVARAGPAVILLGIAYERVFTNCSGACGYWVPQVAVGFAL